MIENNNQINLNEGQKQSFSNKTKTFLKNTTKAVRDTIAATGIAVSTLIPASVESLTTIAPTAAKVVAVPTAAALVTACHDDLDTTPPRIDVVQNQIEIQGGESLRISGNQIYVGNTLMFRCSDDVSTNLNISVTFNGKPISSGYTFNEGGTISVRATDDAGNMSKTTSSQITKKEVAEEIKCSTHLSAVDITKGDQITRDGNAIFAGSKKIFAWDNNDYTLNINYNNDSNAKLPITVEDNSDIAFTLSYKGKSQSRTTKITVNDVEDQNKAPEITRKYPENKIPNILGGVVVKGDNNKLLFGDVVIYEGKDDNTDVCTPSLKLKGSDEERIGKETNSAGTYVFTLTDEKGKSTSVEFQIKSESIDLTNLNNLNMQVGQEVDLLAGIDIPSGIEISKVEVEINGQHSEVKDYHHYTPSQPGTCYIYVTEKGEFGNTYIEKSKNPLTIKDIEHQEYQSITIDNIKPEEILPIIGQVNRGDRNVYKYIEHLRVAEATRIRDMMWDYGTGKYTKEEYQKLMSRLNTGMTREKPLGYDNYEVIGGETNIKPSDHAYTERDIINSLIKHSNLKIVNESGGWYANLNEFVRNDKNSINIFGNSRFGEAYNKNGYNETIFKQDIVDLCNLKNFIIFVAGTNIDTVEGQQKIKIYNGKYDTDEYGVYSLASMANSDKNNYPNSHLLVTIATNQNGDINQTNERSESSKYPMYFADNSLFSGRAFPIRDRNSGLIVGRSAKYPTSDTNYLNVALTDLCFQMHADVKDVDELLDMIRATALTDYIRFDLNGDGDTNDNVDGQPESQPLQLINPAGVFKEYCMVSDIPSSIKGGETITLTKGRYKGIIFDIPGAEVKINGQWIPYNKANESLIKSQNPMNLERRLNTNEAIKYGNKNLKGKIITVDDQWNGLNMDKEISVNIN